MATACHYRDMGWKISENKIFEVVLVQRQTDGHVYQEDSKHREYFIRIEDELGVGKYSSSVRLYFLQRVSTSKCLYLFLVEVLRTDV